MAMMQQPQMVPPGLQAMKPVTPMDPPNGFETMKRAVAQTNDLEDLANLAKLPYGFLAAGKINDLNTLVQSAQAAEQPTQDLNQQNLQQLAQRQQQQMQMQIAQNLAANESMGVPNIVNQMEQNPTIMAASGGMVEGYNEGKTVEEKRLEEFKKNIGVGEIVPRSGVDRGLDYLKRDIMGGGAIGDMYRSLPDFGVTEYLFDKQLSDADRKKLIDKGIDPDKYIKDPEAAIKEALPPAPGTAPGTVSPTDTKESPYGLTSDATIGADSGIRVIDATDRSLSDARDRALSGLEALKENVPTGTAKLDRLKEINKSDILGGAKTFEEALRQRRQAAGLGELGAGQLTRAEEAAEKDKALARRQANLKLVEVGKAVQQGQKGAIQTIGDVLGGLAERKIAADAGERTAERLLTAKRDAIELKREAEARGDVQAGLKFDMDIADANLKIQQKNVEISNKEFEINKNAETQRAKIFADIGLKEAQLEKDFANLGSLDEYRKTLGEAQVIAANAKSKGMTQKDLFTFKNNLIKRLMESAELQAEFGDNPKRAQQLIKQVDGVLKTQMLLAFGADLPNIETIPDPEK
jgi:hypothetical protein